MARRLLYTFGNHMHWVDMQWLWGYDVLPGSIRDMLHLCEQTGVRGNVNFDGIGYEKLAAECPDALASLRGAVAAGVVEPVGGSYGQPYGLFQDGESNVRQRTYGVRSVLRLLGVRPRAFWEEEFDFCPQLPQILAQCGFTSACLFFQWTWHTPEIPREPLALIGWEGLDGTTLPTLPRNDLNLHQWPEDFEPLLGSPLLTDLRTPAVVQWLELMPSRDWMCRSELMLPRLRELLAHPELDVEPLTMSELVAALAEACGEDPPRRRYAMDDVWHGMTLGKNGDRHPRTSRAAAQRLVAAEVLATLAAVLGRPYPQWDVYPTWELEEGWRELLAGQHHDNHECEGLCGSIGRLSMQRSLELSGEVLERTARHLARTSSPGPADGLLATNRTGITRCIADVDPRPDAPRRIVVVDDVPAFGYRLVRGDDEEVRVVTPADVEQTAEALVLSRGGTRVTVDERRGVITQIETTRDGPVLDPARPLGRLRMRRGGRDERFERCSVEVRRPPDVPDTEVLVRRLDAEGRELRLRVRLDPVHDALELRVEADELSRPDPGFGGALRLAVEPVFTPLSLRADTPYAVAALDAGASFRRKYPTGDWMTSPQWFEDVERPFTASSFVDLLAADQASERGLLVAHDGSQQMLRTDAGIEIVLSAYDPWDEDRFHSSLSAGLRVHPHGPLTDARRVVLATMDADPAGPGPIWPAAIDGRVPRALGGLAIDDASGVVAVALHRESIKSGEDLPAWAGHRMVERSGGAATHPIVIRLVELDGRQAIARLTLPGPVATAARTNLLGETDEAGWLDVTEAPPPAWAEEASASSWASVLVPMRPHEIATVMVDVVPARKVFRDLDARREVWATVHRRTDEDATEHRPT